MLRAQLLFCGKVLVLLMQDAHSISCIPPFILTLCKLSAISTSSSSSKSKLNPKPVACKPVHHNQALHCDASLTGFAKALQLHLQTAAAVHCSAHLFCKGCIKHHFVLMLRWLIHQAFLVVLGYVSNLQIKRKQALRPFSTIGHIALELEVLKMCMTVCKHVQHPGKVLTSVACDFLTSH